MSWGQRQFNRVFLKRTKQARIEANLSTEDAAKALGVSEFEYQAFELRSPLPLHMALQFCRITGATPESLFRSS